MRDDDNVHPVVLVLAGIGLGALLAGVAAWFLGQEEGGTSPEGVRRAALQLRERAEALAQRVRKETGRLVESGRQEVDEAIRAGRQAAQERRLELERELRQT